MAVTWGNDHYLKAQFGNWWTGKLSDFSGLMFFPFWVLGSLETVAWAFKRPWVARKHHALLVAGASAVVFGACELSLAANGYYRWLMGWLRALAHLDWAGAVPVRSTPDPSDLLALPCLAVCYFVVARRAARNPAPPNRGDKSSS